MTPKSTSKFSCCGPGLTRRKIRPEGVRPLRNNSAVRCACVTKLTGNRWPPLHRERQNLGCLERKVIRDTRTSDRQNDPVRIPKKIVLSNKDGL